MPFREVTMIEIKETLRLWLGGVPQVKIAEQLGLDRKTVRRYVRAAAARGLEVAAGDAALTDDFLVGLLLSLRTPVERPRGDAWARCAEHRAFIAACLEKSVRLTKVRKLLGRRDAHVPYMTLYRFAVAELGFGRGAATIPVADCEPGEEVQLDTGWVLALELWDESAKVTVDKSLLNEFVSLRFVEQHRHVAIVGPVGVGKTFLAHALGHIACRRGHSVLAVRADQMLKTLKHARLDGTHETELRKLLAVDVLVVDDFGLDAMDQIESRDCYDVFTERHRSGSIIITSNRGPDEWLATFADPLRAQSAIDRFNSNAYDLVVEGESYRSRLKPTHPGSKPSRTGQKEAT